jgi:hypothetical protein
VGSRRDRVGGGDFPQEARAKVVYVDRSYPPARASFPNDLVDIVAEDSGD